MSEAPATIADVADVAAAPPAAPANPPADTTAKPNGDAAKPANGTTMAEGAAPEPAAPVTSSWREDWREAAAGKNEELGKWLARYSSPENAIAAGWQANHKIKTGAVRPVGLPENANDDDIAAYRKSWGVPDKPEGYEVSPPEGIDFSEPETASLNSFLADMHANHVPKPIVQKVADSYFKIRQTEEQQLYEAAVEKTTNQRAEIRAEFDRDFSRNTSLANADLVTVLGPEKARDLASLTLANGTKLGDHPDFVRYSVAKAMATADDSALITSETAAAGGKSIDEQIADIRKMQSGSEADRVKFHSPEIQKRYERLYQLKIGRQSAPYIVL